MSGLPGDAQTKRQRNKVHLLSRTSQGETPNQWHRILKTIIGQCSNT
jgi:hypothetical protein